MVAWGWEVREKRVVFQGIQRFSSAGGKCPTDVLHNSVHVVNILYLKMIKRVKKIVNVFLCLNLEYLHLFESHFMK